MNTAQLALRGLALAEALAEQHTKQAGPAWAKMLAGGRLSSAAKSRLAEIIPAGSSRRLGKQVLGQGAEGVVYPSFTGGGVGSSVTKTHYDAFGQRAITGGGPGSTQPWMDKVNVMRAWPDVFPKIFNVNSRGYSMEPLQSFGQNSPLLHLDVRQNLKYLIPSLRKMRTKATLDAQPSSSWWRRLFGGRSKPDAGAVNHDMLAHYSQWIQKLVAERNTYTPRAMPNDPLVSLADKVRKLFGSGVYMTDKRQRIPITIPGTGTPAYLGDFSAKPSIHHLNADLSPTKFMDFHNIMRARDGRAVISDPQVQRVSAFSSAGT